MRVRAHVPGSLGSATMTLPAAWNEVADALAFAVERIGSDPDPANQRELADGHQYVGRILAVVGETMSVTLDPDRPSFLPMMESVRFVGAAGPDIDYDVAAVRPGGRYRIRGTRGGATYVGIAVYAHAGERGASAIVASVDVDTLVAADGSFEYDVVHPAAGRVIVRQYFHDRAAQPKGSWDIERLDAAPTPGAAPRPTPAAMEARIRNAAHTIRWNAQLNGLWSPELRSAPNRFVRQTPDEIVAAVTNPDVTYAFSWWRVGEGEALVIELTPPETRYWGLQLCDRWFQCQPDRRTNLNDRQLVPEPDGSFRIVVADGDPGHANWLDTGGHRIGTMFFRWLHADPPVLPVCRVVSLGPSRFG